MGAPKRPKRLTRGLEEACEQMDELAESAIEYLDVTGNVLEAEGIRNRHAPIPRFRIN